MKTLLSTSVFLIILSEILFAQNSSVYSRYGIGDMEYSYSSKLISTGDLGTALLDQDHLLVTNPAGWTAMSKTRIEFGFGYKGVLVSDANRSVYNS